jgi:hypothetical protein
MTNSLELLRLADSLDRQGFYKLAQEAEQAAQGQELQENTSTFYGMTGNTAELYSAFNYLQQLKNIFVRPQIRQLFLAGKLNSIDAMINQFSRLGDGNAVKLLQSMSKNKFMASRMKNLSAYLSSFNPGAFFTAEEMKILQNSTKYNANVPKYTPSKNTLPFGGFEATPNTIKQLGGISEEVINKNPKQFRDVLRFLNNGQVDEAINILRKIDGIKTKEIIEFRNKAKNLTNLVQEEANVLKFDKAAIQKGNGVFTALKTMASEIPAVAKVIQVLEWGMSKGLPILGILAGAVEVIAYSIQLKSAPEEEKADIRMDIAQGVINIVGNACMLVPVAAPVGGIILGLNFAADLVQGQSKNWMAQAEGFENAEQMNKTKQIAEQNLSVVSTNPEVTKIMDYIIKKKWMYLSDPIGYKTEVSQLLTPNGVIMEAGSLYGSDANANFWKWSKNTNSPEYLELIQSITQLKQKLYRDARSNPNNFIRSRNPGFTPPRAAKVKVKLKYA